MIETEINDWYPSKREYNPGIKEKQWEQLVVDKSIFTKKRSDNLCLHSKCNPWDLCRYGKTIWKKCQLLQHKCLANRQADCGQNENTSCLA